MRRTMMGDIHQQFIGVVREGRGKRLKDSPEIFSGLHLDRREEHRPRARRRLRQPRVRGARGDQGRGDRRLHVSEGIAPRSSPSASAPAAGDLAIVDALLRASIR